jgi:hypothetical protein
MTAQARRGYEGYAASTGGKTFDGRDMPRWDELPPRIQEAWRAAIVAAVDEPAKAKETTTEVQVRLIQETETAKVARKLTEMLPPGQGFVLLTFDFGPQGNLAYCSNGNRDDCIRMLREWLGRQAAL